MPDACATASNAIPGGLNVKPSFIGCCAVGKTVAVLEEFGDRLNAAVVINHQGKAQLDFHAAEYVIEAHTGGCDSCLSGMYRWQKLIQQ